MIIEQDFLALGLDWLAEHKNLKLCFVDEHDTRRGEDGYVSEYGYWLFFTDCPMSEQWGDDWDDAPYEYNAEWPYDDHFIGENHVEHHIFKMQIYIKAENCPKLPRDYGYNSPFSVDDINSGAVAWMYFAGKERKACNGTAIQASMSPWDVFYKACNMFVQPTGIHENTDY